MGDFEYPGGGLLTLVKEDIVFKENGHSQRGIFELLSTSIHQTGKKWLTLNNVYIPPKGQIDLDWVPLQANSVFAGDFNGHCQIWDDVQPSDQRGDQLVDWLLDNDLSCLNDGSPTRMNPGTCGLSTPDITFVSPELSPKSK